MANSEPKNQTSWVYIKINLLYKNYKFNLKLILLKNNILPASAVYVLSEFLYFFAHIEHYAFYSCSITALKLLNIFKVF